MEYPGTYPQQGGNPPRRAGIRGPRLAALLLSLVMLVTGVLGVPGVILLLLFKYLL